MAKDPRRWRALDALRGLAVFLMLPVNAAMGFTVIPAWFKHAPASGFSMPDFIMPAFLFSLGLSSSFSLKARLEGQGAARTIVHGLFRYALLFAFGSIGYFLVWKQENWEILQMLGLTGALAFPFLFLSPRWRFAVAGAFIVLVEVLRPAVFGPAFTAWYGSGIGGPLGCVPLAAIPIAASGMGELLRQRPWRKRAALAGYVAILLAGAGELCSAFVAGPDKHLLTASYILIAVAVACLALALLEAASGVAGDWDLPLLGAVGRNPLLAYMAGGLLTLGVQAIAPASAPASTAWALSLGVLAAMTFVALWLDRKGIWLRL